MAKRKKYPKSWHVRSFEDRNVEVLRCEVLRSSIKRDGRCIAQIKIDGTTFLVSESTIFDTRKRAYDEARWLVSLRIDRLRANMRRLDQEANR